MNNNNKSNNNMKNGSILVTVLVIIAACTTLVLFIHERTMNAYGTVINIYNDYQGAMYAMTAIEALEMAFQYDEESYDCSDDIWAQIPTVPIDNGFLTVTIKPLNSKVPLAGLSSSDEDLQERVEEAVSTLLTDLELTDADLEELKLWVGLYSSTGEKYDENSAPYITKSASLQTLAELAYVETFGYDYQTLSAYVSIAGDDNKINLNLASEEVIRAYVPELESYIDDIIDTRTDSPFTDVSAIYDIMGSGMKAEYTAILPYIDVKSTLFYIKIELNIGEDYLYYHLLVERNGSSVTPIRYIEGNNIEYF